MAILKNFKEALARQELEEALGKEALEEDFDLSGFDDEIFADMMKGFIEANNHQTMLAMELTRLVIEKSPEQSMSADNIFAVFKRAMAVIYESSPLKDLLGKFN